MCGPTADVSFATSAGAYVPFALVFFKPIFLGSSSVKGSLLWLAGRPMHVYMHVSFA